MTRFSIDQDLHLHSQLSACSSDPAQTPERILQCAKENRLSTICLTDHYWDSAVPSPSDWYAPQNFEHIAASRPLPSTDGIRLLFGCETDLNKDMTLGLPTERYDEFDFIVIPTTHLHMTGFTISESDAASLTARARLWVERLDAVLQMPLPFHKVGIAHLVCPLLAPSSRKDYLTVLDSIPTRELDRVFRRAAELGVGIELNAFDMKFTNEEADTVLRIFRMAKAAGCRFYTASDAHHPDDFLQFRPLLERVVDLLELRESDKFYV